jgi:hypothetical protein
MSKLLQVPDSTRYLLEATLGPSLAHELLLTLTRWVSESGVEWTVKRLKALNTAAKQLRAGNHSIVKAIYQSESIAYQKCTLYPKNKVYKTIFNTVVTAQKPSVLKRHFAILRIGTMFRLEQCTRTQIQASLTTIERSPVDPETPAISNLITMLEHSTRKAIGDVSHKIQPVNLKRLKPFTSTYSVGQAMKELASIPYGKAVHSLTSSSYIPESLWVKLPEEVQDLILLVRESGADEGTTGKLTFLSEKGAKCRTIAVPNAWIQLLMEPVHSVLDNIARRLPESAVHDQNKGAFFMKDHLGLGREIWCFDLSSATDLFPLALQRAVLRGLNLDEYGEALEEMTSYWEVHQGQLDNLPRHVDYKSGQPMGMYGSFPLFHLTHLLLLKSIEEICSRHYGSEIRNSFRVLGDDVIIVDKSVATTYEKIMRVLQVPISQTKSVNSTNVGEFAGFLGVKTRDSVAIFRPFKHGIQGRDNGPLNLINALGSKCQKLPQKWGSWYELYRHTLSWRNPDLSPLIPEKDKPGILPDKINRGKLELLLSTVFSARPYAESNLDYSFGDSPFDEELRAASYALLDEQRTGPSGSDIGLDVTRPKPVLNSVEEAIFDDPLMKEARSGDLASSRTSLFSDEEPTDHYSLKSNFISSCTFFNEETKRCSRQSDCPQLGSDICPFDITRSAD